MLAELKRAHRELLERVVQFETLTRGSRPDSSLMANVRLHLTRASGERRLILEKIYPMLDSLSPEEAERVRQLRAEGTSMLIEASQYVATWTIARILREWPAYQQASLHVARSNRRRVADEQALIYPLLMRQVASGRLVA